MTDIAEGLAARQAEMEALVAERLAENPDFARELVDDPTAAMAPIIAAALGGSPDAASVPVTIDADAARLLLDTLDGGAADADDVAGFDGTAPLPYPDIGGGSGGSTGTGATPSGSTSTGNVGAGAMKSVTNMATMGKSTFIGPSMNVKVEGKGVVITTSPGMSNR
jgi:hypothetical protein